MGLILSRVRKKKSAVETLEKLENDIKQIEEDRSNAQMRHKRLTKMLLTYSLGLYVLFGLFLYFQYTATIQVKLLYLVPLAVSPLLLYIIKRIISWYYVRRINQNQNKLNEMKKEKKRILDEVMDKETYKVAKEILEKYSTESKSKINVNQQQIAAVKKPNDGLRKRVMSLPNSPPMPPPPGSPMRNFGVNQPRAINQSHMGRGMQVPGLPPARTPVPILPLNRSYVDRVVEYLIGDGPNNRYALICSQCHSHNGMALKEEFEYIGFKCCYCHFYNPARKMRPEAPKLDVSFREHKESDSDSESKNSEHSDSEFKTDMKAIDKSGDNEALNDKNEAEKKKEVKNAKLFEQLDLLKSEEEEKDAKLFEQLDLLKSEEEEKDAKLFEQLDLIKSKEERRNVEKSQNDEDCDEPLLKT